MNPWELWSSWSLEAGAALVRGTWQGGLALGLVWLACRLFPRLSPNARTWLWRLAYARLLLALVWSGTVPLAVLAPARVPEPAAAGGATSSLARGPSGAAAAPGALRANPGPAGAPALPPAAPAVPSPHPAPAGRAQAFVPYLAALWVLAAAGMALRLLRDWRAAQRLRREAGAAADPWLGVACQELGRRMGLRHQPELLISDEGGSPLLVGVVRPAILVPAPVLARSTAAELEMMLAHELAHLARRDLLWSSLPALARVLLFFHPLEWAGSREWRLAQELACDEQALSITRASMGDYGQLLVKVGAQHFPASTPGAGLVTVGVVNSARTLRMRLIAMKSLCAAPAHPGRLAAGLALAALVGLVPWQFTHRPAELFSPARAAAITPPARTISLDPPGGGAPPAAPASARAAGAPGTAESPRAAGAGPGTLVLPPGAPPAAAATAPPPAFSTGPAAPARNPGRGSPLPPEGLAAVIVDLRSPDGGRRQRAANQLDRAPPADAPGADRAEVARRLEALLDDPDLFIRAAAVRALRSWGTTASVPLLIRRLEDPEHAVRWAAIDVLGALRDARAADPLARMVSAGRDRGFASRALQALGPAAEAAGIRLLQDPDSWARLEGCRILQAVGGQASIAPLERMRQEPDGLVRMAAGDALQAASARARTDSP